MFFILCEAKSQIVAVILSTAIDGLSQDICSVFSQIYPFFLGTLYPEPEYLPMGDPYGDHHGVAGPAKKEAPCSMRFYGL